MILIKTFNGFSLANSDYVATATSAKTPPDAKNVFIEQTDSDALYAGTFTRDIRSVVVTVRIIDQANMEELESELKEALKPGKDGLLVGTFTDENRDYQLNCAVQSIHLSTTYEGLYTVIFQTGESAWHAVTETTDTWAVSATGDTKSLTVGGYSETRLSLTLTPTQLPATGWAYQRLYQLVNKPGYAYGLRPWLIMLDTAALVTAGKMQADCDDLKVIVDGIETKRWLVDVNTSSTKIWININLSAGQSMTLLTPIASSGAISAMAFTVTTNNYYALSALPARGYICHGTEWFEYSGKSITRSGYVLTGVTRAALGTTMQAHSAGDIFYWAEHTIFLLYGNSAATAPSLTDSTYDDNKPVIDLSTSTNSSWVYTASTKFYDLEKPNRTGQWIPSIKRTGDESQTYTEQGNVEGAAPALGMLISSWNRNGRPTAESSIQSWLIKNAGGIETISLTGRKYRNTTLWPAVKAAILQKSINSTTWIEVWSELTPTAVSTWESFTHASAAITPAVPWVRLYFGGSLAANADVDCYFEGLTATVNFVSTNQPTGTMGAEKGNYLLSVKITNSTNGDAISLIIPMLLNTVMDLDGEGYAVTYNGVDAASALSLDDESREIWIRLSPGANELVITGEDIATLTIVPSWYERRI